MAAPQQFSLRWNNYSQHIVTALEDLRADDELTDVTLSCEGQRIRGHKVLLSACSTFFRETFKENPCKHPVIIIKGVSFLDLEAVVTFMYNGQVNVSQDRLPTFLSAAELLQIKGLTDMNDKEEPKKRTIPGNLSHSASRSGTPDVQRPPSPKRKRVLADDSQSSSNLLTTKSLAASSSTGANSSSGLNSHDAGSSSTISAMNNNNTDHDPFQPDVSIKYEDQDDDEYDEKTHMSADDNDISQDDMMCGVEPGSIGSFGSGAGVGGSGNDSSHGSYDKRRVRRPQKHHSSTESSQSSGDKAPGPSILAGSSLLDQLEIVGVEEDDESQLGLSEGNNGYNGDDGIYTDEHEEGDEVYNPAGLHGSNIFRAQSAVAATASFPLNTRIASSQQNRPRSVQKTISTVAFSRNLEVPFVCDICGKGYVHACTLVQHMKLHEGQTTCRLCSQTLSNVSNLRQHYQSMHGYSLNQVQGKAVFDIR